jgi:PEP-CTERM motif
MSIRYVLSGSLIAIAAIGVPVAQAAVVTTLANGTAIPIPTANILTSGPETFGPLTFTSNALGKFGWTSSFDFGNNGSWTGTPPFIGLNVSSNGNFNYATMTFTFDTPTSGILADLNWNAQESGNLQSYLAAYDSDGALIDVLALIRNGGGVNAVQPGFWGFSRAQADIKYFQLSNGFVALRELSYVAPAISAVPEPTTWAMVIAGFGIVGAGLRRPSRRTQLQLV